ncbi:MAG: PilZ domain-containing protein [Candidatus Aminicenantes bacterium]|nr:PilZ domain-containing protein [Candidatus Aminicenantes bacterium]
MEPNNQAKEKKKGRGEKRKEPRIKARVKVKAELLVKEEDEKDRRKKAEIWAFTQEISVGGLRLLLPFELKKGEVLSLELLLPSKRIINVGAEVRWQQRSLISGLYETGLEFKILSPEARLALMEFLYLKKIKKTKGGEE